jgi:hypothetical protein
MEISDFQREFLGSKAPLRELSMEETLAGLALRWRRIADAVSDG